MPDATLDGADGDDDDWVLLPPNQATGHNSRLSFRNRYLSFQLNIHVTRSSDVVLPTPTTSQITESEGQRHIHSQEQSPLFQLPVEIRLNIYEYLLRIPDNGSGVELVHCPARERTPTCLTILLTCRRILAEAEDIFYSINRLSVEHPQKLWASLGPRRRSAITTFTLPAQSAGSTFHGMQQLRHFQNLTSLHIQRKLSIKYLEPKSWAVMAPQMAAEIRGTKGLIDVKIFTPEATDLTEHDMVRKTRMEEIDWKICNAAVR